MGKRSNFHDDLGQHMTPKDVADLLTSELPSGVTCAVDLAVGDGALLTSLAKRFPRAALHGIDCDESRLVMARTRVGGAGLKHGDGLSIRFPRLTQEASRRVAVIGNPPFLLATPTQLDLDWQSAAFSGLQSRHGLRRQEVSFLSRALVEGRKRGGIVAMLMPSPFASGDYYAPYRQTLLRDYRLLKVVSIENARYRDTEASTVLVIVDTADGPTRDVEISRFEATMGVKEVVYSGPVGTAERLDAGYWSAIDLHRCGVQTLGDVGVDVTRGRLCNADAARRSQRVLHTTDLCKLRGQSIRLSPSFESGDDGFNVLAERGDILLSRTGTRVRWEPVVVHSGSASITDHVLRIRAPHGVRDEVKASFLHPHFPKWLASVSKGVCATVVTKQDLLRMPLFASIA